MSAAPAVGQETGKGLGLSPSFLVAVAGAAMGAVDLLLPALPPGDRRVTCCRSPSLDLQGCSELCVPRLGALTWPARLVGEGDVGREVMNVYRSMVGLADGESEETVLAC